MSTETGKREQYSNLSLFPFQLMDVRLYEASIVRQDLDEFDQDNLQLLVNVMSGDEPVDADEFGILVAFKSTLPPGEEPSCYVEISVEGLFRSVVEAKALKPEIVEHFKEKDALVLLWPYLREFLHNVTTKMRLDIPPLPIIDPSVLTLNVDDGEISKDGQKEVPENSDA